MCMFLYMYWFNLRIINNISNKSLNRGIFYYNESMRYEFYLTKTPIFWNNTNEDKPSPSLFSSWNFDWIKVKQVVNWVSQTEANCILDDDTYTYVKIVDTEKNFTYYWLVNDISMKMKKGYGYTLILDTYATYLIPWLNILKDRNDITIDMERGFVKDTTPLLQLNDPLLDLQPNKIANIEAYGEKLNTWFEKDGFDNCIIPVSETSGYGIKIPTSEKGPTNTLSDNYNGFYFESLQVYFVARAKDTGTVFFYPCIGDWTPKDYSSENIAYFARATKVNNEWVVSPNIKFDNTFTVLNNYLSHSDRISEFEGIFLGPNFIDMVKNFGATLTYRVDVTLPNFTKADLIRFDLPVQGRSVNLSLDLNEVNNGNVLYNSIVISNKSTKPSKYNFFRQDIRWGNYPSNLINYEKDGKINIVGTLLFSDGFSVIPSPIRNRVISDDSDMISYGGKLPTNINAYNEYVAGIKSSMNTQIQIAKQQAILGGVKAVVGGLTGGLSGFASGSITETDRFSASHNRYLNMGPNSIRGGVSNKVSMSSSTTTPNPLAGPVGAVGAIANAGLGIASSVLSYYNTKNTLKANYEDNVRTLKANVLSSNVSDLVYFSQLIKLSDYYVNSLGNNRFNFFGNVLTIKKWDENTITRNENLIFKYGYYLSNFYLPQDVFFDNEANKDAFYFQPKEYWLQENFKYVLEQEQLLSTLNLVMIDNLITQLGGGLRIWNTRPNPFVKQQTGFYIPFEEDKVKFIMNNVEYSFDNFPVRQCFYMGFDLTIKYEGIDIEWEKTSLPEFHMDLAYEIFNSYTSCMNKFKNKLVNSRYFSPSDNTIINNKFTLLVNSIASSTPSVYQVKHDGIKMWDGPNVREICNTNINNTNNLRLWKERYIDNASYTGGYFLRNYALESYYTENIELTSTPTSAIKTDFVVNNLRTIYNTYKDTIKGGITFNGVAYNAFNQMRWKTITLGFIEELKK